MKNHNPARASHGKPKRVCAADGTKEKAPERRGLSVTPRLSAKLPAPGPSCYTCGGEQAQAEKCQRSGFGNNAATGRNVGVADSRAQSSYEELFEAVIHLEARRTSLSHRYTDGGIATHTQINADVGKGSRIQERIDFRKHDGIRHFISTQVLVEGGRNGSPGSIARHYRTTRSTRSTQANLASRQHHERCALRAWGPGSRACGQCRTSRKQRGHAIGCDRIGAVWKILWAQKGRRGVPELAEVRIWDVTGQEAGRGSQIEKLLGATRGEHPNLHPDHQVLVDRGA